MDVRYRDGKLFLAKQSAALRFVWSWSDVDPATIDPKSVSGYITRAKEEGIVAHLLGIIPNSFFDAFAKGRRHRC